MDCWTGRFGGLFAPKDAIDIPGGAEVLVEPVWPVRDQAAGSDECVIRVDGRKSVTVAAMAMIGSR